MFLSSFHNQKPPAFLLLSQVLVLIVFMEFYGLWLYATGNEKEEKYIKKSAWIEKKKKSGIMHTVSSSLPLVSTQHFAELLLGLWVLFQQQWMVLGELADYVVFGSSCSYPAAKPAEKILYAVPCVHFLSLLQGWSCRSVTRVRQKHRK